MNDTAIIDFLSQPHIHVSRNFAPHLPKKFFGWWWVAWRNGNGYNGKTLRSAARKARCGGPSRGTARRVRLVREAAEIRVRRIYLLQRQGKTHRQIAARLHVKMSVVAYYLSARCKAAYRVGLR